MSRDLIVTRNEGDYVSIRLKEDIQSTSKRFSIGGTGSITGRVTECTEDGNQAIPLSYVNLVLYESDDPYWAGRNAWNYVTSSSTDSQGNYSFYNLEARQYRIQIFNQTIGDTHYVEANMYNVQVFEGATTQNMNFQLRKAGLIWGYVKTTDGTPITHTRVIARLPFTHDGQGWHDSWEIDANGRYELWLLPSPGKFYPMHIQDSFIPGRTYKVYGGTEYISGEDVFTLEDHGYELLGSSTATHTFDGSYNYYVIMRAFESNYLKQLTI
jgi:hypothetical protein